MRRALQIALALLFAFGPGMAEDESACPSSSASKEGFAAIEKFHEIIAPVWHGSYPQKDYAAMFTAGPKFDSAFIPINKFAVVFKTEVRARTFEEHRADFRRLVKEYAGACAVADSAKVYELLPALHDAFEQTASALLPVDYPQFDGLVVTLDLIINQHLPAKNMDGIAGSTETLVNKMDGLTEQTIPPELMEKKGAIMAEFAAMKKVVADIKDCSDKKDLDDLKIQVNILQEMTKQFKERFL